MSSLSEEAMAKRLRRNLGIRMRSHYFSDVSEDLVPIRAFNSGEVFDYAWMMNHLVHLVFYLSFFVKNKSI